MMKFAEPQNPQSYSRFAHLPNELRFQILRLLVLFPPEEAGYTKKQRRENMRAGLILGQTCQFFYLETSKVFYVENVLTFVFHTGCTDAFHAGPGYDPYCRGGCPTGNASSRIWLQCLPLGIQSWIVVDLDELCPVSDETTVANLPLSMILTRRMDNKHMVSLLRKFDRFEFKLYGDRESTPPMTAIVLQVFAPVLKDKALVLTYENYGPSDNHRSSSLRGLKTPGCASIKVGGTLVIANASKDLQASDDGRDLYKEWVHIFDMVLARLPKRGQKFYFWRTYKKELWDFTKSVWDNDVEEYTKGLRQILQWALNWQRGYFREERVRLEYLSNAAYSCRDLVGLPLMSDFGTGLLDDTMNISEESVDDIEVQLEDGAVRRLTRRAQAKADLDST